MYILPPPLDKSCVRPRVIKWVGKCAVKSNVAVDAVQTLNYIFQSFQGYTVNFLRWKEGKNV